MARWPTAEIYFPERLTSDCIGDDPHIELKFIWKPRRFATWHYGQLCEPSHSSIRIFRLGVNGGILVALFNSNNCQRFLCLIFWWLFRSRLYRRFYQRLNLKSDVRVVFQENLDVLLALAQLRLAEGVERAALFEDVMLGS